MPGPFYGLTAASGLHILKDSWCQKSYLQEQCSYLAENLTAAIQTTFDAAPLRDGSFQLDRADNDDIDESQRERRWERSAYRRWRTGTTSPIPKCWQRLVAFQVPLFGSLEVDHWGYIDLLGLLVDGTPCIVELKREPTTSPQGSTQTSESPLRMVLEAAAYAISLRKNWERFLPEFCRRLESLEVQSALIERLPKTLTKVQLVGVAPAAYWLDWLPVTEKGRTVSDDAWKAFRKLTDRLGDEGLSVSFVSVSGDIDRPGSLAAQPLTVFP